MLDRAAMKLLRPGLNAAARGLARIGLHADHVTLIGFGIGIAAALSIAFEQFIAGLLLLLVSRLCDGIDGALARLTAPTDRGSFLDITLDFLFYASIPLAFALARPAVNALPAAVLLAAFIGTATTFLAFATLAAQRGMTSAPRPTTYVVRPPWGRETLGAARRLFLMSAGYPDKGIYYLGGLTEATETLTCFALMCLWPALFAPFAYGFAALCGLTILMRLWAGWRAFSA